MVQNFIVSVRPPGDLGRYTANQSMYFCMATHVLMMNLRGSSWDFIPDDLWRNIVKRFATKYCNGVSFDSVATADEITRLSVFSDHKPTHIGDASYTPISVPLSVKSPETYQHSVALFQFDEWIASLILEQPFNTWSAGNDGADADEIVFWSDERMKLHAIPYEGQAYFDNLTGDERQCLVEADRRIDRNLHAV